MPQGPAALGFASKWEALPRGGFQDKIPPWPDGDDFAISVRNIRAMREHWTKQRHRANAYQRYAANEQ